MRRFAAARLGSLIVLLLVLSEWSHAAQSKQRGHITHVAAVPPPERLGAAAAWTAYTYDEKSGKVCYVASRPQKSEPNGARRKTPTAMVTHRPGENAANVVSFAEGYPLKEGSEVLLDVGGTRFDLFTKGDSAWAQTSDLDKTIVETMAKGKQAVVKGMPQKGPGSIDTYSLAGFAQALAMIDKACEIKR